MARIGFVSMSFARGQWYVTERLMQAVQALGHTPYLFARQGQVYGQPMHETAGAFAWPQRHDYPSYEIIPGDLQAWAVFHKLAAVVFNEEYDFTLPIALRQQRIKTLHYVDAYLAEAWRPLLRYYDQLWCVTHRSEAILQGWGKGDQTHYIGWGVPDDLIRHPMADPTPRYPVVHSAGWLGLGARKGTDVLLEALRRLGDAAPATCIHAQLPWAFAQQVLGWTDALPPSVVWDETDLPPPGIAPSGRLVAQPSKIEGFGLSIVEAMCAGRLVITTDAPPMSEFVTPETGWLVDVEGFQPHTDGSVYQQAIIRPEALAKVLEEAVAIPMQVLDQKRWRTYGRAKRLFNWQDFQTRLQVGLEKVGIA